eukprot:TRINITY_DN18060_c0_g1_i1.p1 TRINITY_DN18060_c0_g1~~TRINITY_DN18060_c0_g1_i1.p1  ORF type:complete len:178 (+),score=43.50 TRINITY_DN18060_c0_g1_i1:60-536(+)
MCIRDRYQRRVHGSELNTAKEVEELPTYNFTESERLVERLNEQLFLVENTLNSALNNQFDGFQPISLEISQKEEPQELEESTSNQFTKVIASASKDVIEQIDNRIEFLRHGEQQLTAGALQSLWPKSKHKFLSAVTENLNDDIRRLESIREEVKKLSR